MKKLVADLTLIILRGFALEKMALGHRWGLSSPKLGKARPKVDFEKSRGNFQKG